jgi:hypothetical protein
MLDEPRSRHRAVDNLSRFIVQNYLVAAHVAAARIQVRSTTANWMCPQPRPPLSRPPRRPCGR